MPCKGTNKRAKYQIYLSISERRSRSTKGQGTNKRAKYQIYLSISIHTTYICSPKKKVFLEIAVYLENSRIFAPFNHINTIIMSEKQKQVEKERRGVLEILLQKNGLKRKELVDFLLGVWVAGKLDELTEQEKAQFPNLAF